MKTIEHVEECQSCGGTGLKVGLAEKDGAAVVCHNCKGTGAFKYKHEYEEFTERCHHSAVVHVVQVNPGIIVGTGGGYVLEQFGGMSYEEWKKGQPFPAGSEMREFTCPAWWYQSADYAKKPEWEECGCGHFSDCREFPKKVACWTKWDAEFGPAAEEPGGKK